jgi:two-component system sensor histidine kinase BaeS
MEERLRGARDRGFDGIADTLFDEDMRSLFDPELGALIVNVAADPISDSQFLVNTRRAASVAIIMAGAVSILLGTILFRQITRPLQRLRGAVNQYAQGNLSVRTPVRSSDEVGRLAIAFNQMAEELEKQEELRQKMVADVAHELRTPLSVMRGNIEAMTDGLLIPDKEELVTLQDEVSRLTRIIDDLRLLSQADAGQLVLNLTPIEVNRFINRVVALMKPIADKDSVVIRALIGPAPMYVRGDEDRLQQALINLIENAIRNSSPGTRVEITAAVKEEIVLISVSDQGPGIPELDLPHIFDRFWRGDKSRSRASGGSGIGLSIVKQIVDLHGGAVQVESSDSGGSCFTIDLPAEPDAE